MTDISTQRSRTMWWDDEEETDERIQNERRKDETTNEGGWEFWQKVYENKNLRQAMDENAQEDLSMSQLMKSSSLCRAELIFLNVPRLCGSQAAIRSFITQEMRSNIPILDVHCTPKKWCIRFYRDTDALAVMKHFDQFVYQNRRMIVRYNSDEVQLADVTKVEKLLSTCSIPKSPSITSFNIYEERDPIWTAIEWADIINYKNDVITLLSRCIDGVAINRITCDIPMRRKGMALLACEEWLLALLRLFSPQVKLTGRYVSLSEQNNMTTLLRKAAMEGTPRVALDSWEPMAPLQVRTDHNLRTYLTAFLTHFGPQHTIIDIPIRLLVKTLGGAWPSTAPLLAEKACSLSSSFIMLDDVLYLSNSVRHRKVLLEYIQPSSSFRRQFVHSS